jgi:hypothetical protein
MQRRDHANEHTDHRRDDQAENEHGSVQPDRGDARQFGRAEGHQCPYAEFGHQHSERATDRGEEQALYQQLPHESPACRAECGAYRELASSLRASREHEVRHVDAGDCQHEQHGTEHGEEGRPDATSHVRLERVVPAL